MTHTHLLLTQDQNSPSGLFNWRIRSSGNSVSSSTRWIGLAEVLSNSVVECKLQGRVCANFISRVCWLHWWPCNAWRTLFLFLHPDGQGASVSCVRKYPSIHHALHHKLMSISGMLVLSCEICYFACSQTNVGVIVCQRCSISYIHFLDPEFEHKNDRYKHQRGILHSHVWI